MHYRSCQLASLMTMSRSICAPFHFAGIEIVIAFDDPNLSSELVKFRFLPNLGRDLSVIFMNSVR
jgi:hypothetical protein